MSPVLWWVKKDVRLADNPALTAALDTGAPVVPVFLFEPTVLRAEETSGFHVAAWIEALADLRSRLRPHGGDVLALHADAVEAFGRLHEAAPFEAIYSHEEVGSSVTFERDKAVAAWCEAHGVAWHEHRQTGVFRGGVDRDKRSARWKAFMADGPLPVPDDAALARVRVPDALRALQPPEGATPTPGAFGHPLTDVRRDLRQPVSETAAEETLRSFLHERGFCYSGGISSPNDAFECGSRLSVHLAWGTLTGRQAYAATEARRLELKDIAHPDARQWEKSLRAFTSRLHWRDHFIQRLESEPQMEFVPLNPAYADLPTPGDEHVEAWLGGRTGWPLVDACMRCAAATGFLNFRMRALVTSVAVHTLRIDWRKTLYPVARLWADYEPGIHIAQTQMQAGVVGINQLRVYSPEKQLADHDPEAVFVKRWVPELADVPAEAILKHHARPLPDYPAPIVDRLETSKAFKDDYYAIKRLPETQALAERVYERHGSRRPASARTWTSNAPRKTKKAKLPKPAPLFDVEDRTDG
ncbi:MAG: FAD-binding domain-containing protein [Rhodothermales bacterium]